MNYIVTDTANVKFTVNNVSSVEISNNGSLIFIDNINEVMLMIHSNYWMAVVKEDAPIAQ